MSTLYERVDWVAGETAISSGNLNQMDKGIRAVMPVGAEIMSMADSYPGFLKLDGATVLRGNYPELFQWVQDQELLGAGKPFGDGDGATTFVLPDRRQRFPRATPAGSSPGEVGGSNDHSHVNPSTSSAGGHSHTNPSTSSAGSHAHTNPTTGSAGSHSHTVGNTGTAGDHNHGGTQSAGSHSHSFSDGFTTGGPSASTQNFQIGSGILGAIASHTHSGSVSGTTSSHSGHSHGINTSGDHSHTNPGTSSQASHQHSVGNTSSGGSHSHSVGDTGSAAAHSHGQGATEVSSNLPMFYFINIFIAT